jgi:hypothetical protein
MNFKPTLWKSIVSIVGGIIVGLFYSSTYDVCDINYCPSAFQKLFDYPTSFIYLLVGLVAIYIIWSLIQKKK